MGKVLTYYDYAKNDYYFFQRLYQEGYRENKMASMSQEICEKYLKHVIDEYIETESEEKKAALKAHNIKKILNYIESSLPDFKCERNVICQCNGFYFDTRYPGDESYFASKQDIEEGYEAVEACRNAVEQYITEKEREKEQQKEEKEKRTKEEIAAFVRRNNLKR